MSIKIKIGSEVFVPRSQLGLDPNDVSPFYQTTVREKEDRSVRVDVPGGSLSDWVATSRLSLRMGILIIRIGDFEESQLIDPLFKSVLHFCRMLLPGDYVRAIEIRTIRELVRFWKDYHHGYRHVIFIGHGSSQNIFFGNRGVSASRLVQILGTTNPEPKEFISLCCKTGLKDFGKTFSGADFCDALLAPFHSIHGCIASQFCQSYLSFRLLDHKSIGIAFNKARENVIGAASFRLWQAGGFKAN